MRLLLLPSACLLAKANGASFPVFLWLLGLFIQEVPSGCYRVLGRWPRPWQARPLFA